MNFHSGSNSSSIRHSHILHSSAADRQFVQQVCGLTCGLWKAFIFVRAWTNLVSRVQAGRSSSVRHRCRLRDGSRVERHDQRYVSRATPLLGSQPARRQRSATLHPQRILYRSVVISALYPALLTYYVIPAAGGRITHCFLSIRENFQSAVRHKMCSAIKGCFAVMKNKN